MFSLELVLVFFLGVSLFWPHRKYSPLDFVIFRSILAAWRPWLVVIAIQALGRTEKKSFIVSNRSIASVAPVWYESKTVVSHLCWGEHEQNGQKHRKIRETGFGTLCRCFRPVEIVSCRIFYVRVGETVRVYLVISVFFFPVFLSRLSVYHRNNARIHFPRFRAAIWLKLTIVPKKPMHEHRLTHVDINYIWNENERPKKKNKFK